MARAVLAALVALVACQAVFGSAPLCPPQQWQTNYIMSGDNVGMYGFMAVDYKGQNLAMNETGIQSNGFGYDGQYLFTNGTGYWISNNFCVKVGDNNPLGEYECLPSNGNTTYTTVGGVNATIYTINTMDSNGEFVNTTSWYYAQDIPISYQAYAPQTAERAPYAANFLFLNPSKTVDPNLFNIPTICNGANEVMIHETPLFKRRNRMPFKL